MIPVEQRQLVDLANNQPGDCLNACIASICELPYEQVPFFLLYGDAWWNTLVMFLRSHGWGIDRFGLWGLERPYLMFGSEEIEYVWSLVGYWLASVRSPRFVEEDGEPGLHLIVMRGDTVAWDPHPQREMGHLGFVEAYVLTPGLPLESAA